jgi:ankyrin repeat protein
MPTARRHIGILSCLIPASFIFGCSSAPVNTTRTSNSNVSPFKPSSPVKTTSPDQQLLEVAGASGFKEEPDDPAAAMSLLDAGANVNAIDSAGVPVLTVAVRSGRIKVAEALLARGADVNAQDDRGETALMVAAGSSDPKMVRLLLDYKADPNLKDASGFTALSGSEMVGGSSDPDYLAVRRMLKKAGAK